MKRSTEEILAQAARDRAAAVQLMQAPGADKLIRYLQALWLTGDRTMAANHGQAGWALAMHQAIEDLRRLREDGS